MTIFKISDYIVAAIVSAKHGWLLAVDAFGGYTRNVCKPCPSNRLSNVKFVCDVCRMAVDVCSLEVRKFYNFFKFITIIKITTTVIRGQVKQQIAGGPNRVGSG